jgi:hypothetical protein
MKVNKRLKDAEVQIKELVEEGIIKLEGDNIIIEFLDEQLEKLDKTSKKNSQNGAKGAAARWNKPTPVKDSIAPPLKEHGENMATPLKNNGETIALREDKKREDKIREDNIRGDKNLKVYSKEVNDCFKNCLKYFDENLHPKTETQKNNWLDTLDKLNRIEKLEFHLIQKIVKKTREDEFWSKNFLSITKLRAKNKEQIMYVVVFYEKFKTNGKTNSKETGSTVSKEYINGIIDTLQSD